MADLLITGCTGLLGSRLLGDLVGRHRVTAVTRHLPKSPAPGVDWVVHDLHEPALPSQLPTRIDTVIHLAQSRAFRDFPSNAGDIFSVNVGSTALLLDWALKTGATRFILASTGGVYTTSAQLHREDESIWAPHLTSYYSATKYAAEVLTHAYRGHLLVVILRFFYIYGPGQAGGMLVPRLIASLRDGQPIRLQGEDGLRLNPVYVDDAARAVTSTLDVSAGAVINVAGPEIVTLRELASQLAVQMGAAPLFHTEPGYHPRDIVGDISLMTELLGSPRVRLREGVAQAVRLNAGTEGGGTPSPA